MRISSEVLYFVLTWATMLVLPIVIRLLARGPLRHSSAIAVSALLFFGYHIAFAVLAEVFATKLYMVLGATAAYFVLRWTSPMQRKQRLIQDREALGYAEPLDALEQSRANAPASSAIEGINARLRLPLQGSVSVGLFRLWVVVSIAWVAIVSGWLIIEVGDGGGYFVRTSKTPPSMSLRDVEHYATVQRETLLGTRRTGGDFYEQIIKNEKESVERLMSAQTADGVLRGRDASSMSDAELAKTAKLDETTVRKDRNLAMNTVNALLVVRSLSSSPILQEKVFGTGTSTRTVSWLLVLFVLLVPPLLLMSIVHAALWVRAGFRRTAV